MQEVLELNHEVLVLRERLECIHPVLDRKERLLVRIYLSKQLLLEHVRQVEASQSIVLVHKCDELHQVNLVRLPGGIVERVLKIVVDF